MTTNYYMSSKEYRIFCRHNHLAPLSNDFDKVNFFVINNGNKIKKLKKVEF